MIKVMIQRLLLRLVCTIRLIYILLNTFLSVVRSPSFEVLNCNFFPLVSCGIVHVVCDLERGKKAPCKVRKESTLGLSKVVVYGG